MYRKPEDLEKWNREMNRLKMDEDYANELTSMGFVVACSLVIFLLLSAVWWYV